MNLRLQSDAHLLGSRPQSSVGLRRCWSTYIILHCRRGKRVSLKITRTWAKSTVHFSHCCKASCHHIQTAIMLPLPKEGESHYCNESFLMLPEPSHLHRQFSLCLLEVATAFRRYSSLNGEYPKVITRYVLILTLTGWELLTISKRLNISS